MPYTPHKQSVRNPALWECQTANPYHPPENLSAWRGLFLWRKRVERREPREGYRLRRNLYIFVGEAAFHNVASPSGVVRELIS